MSSSDESAAVTLANTNYKYKRVVKIQKMSYQGQVEEDNISIEIDPAMFDKPDSQLTEQLYEMARRIAESDRNNQVCRQAKKSKSLELEVLRHNKKDIQGELEELQLQVGNKKSMEYDNTFSRNNRAKFEEVNAMCQDLAAKEKQVQRQTCEVIKQNQKLEKKLSVLQVEYEIMLKENNHKSLVSSKLLKQRQEKIDTIQHNSAKIAELESQCEATKKRAEDLEQELKQELKSAQQLENLIREREVQAEAQKKKKQETSRKHEESKRALLKMVNSAKSLELEIECKLKEGHKLHQIHESMKQKIFNMQLQQKKLEEFILNRKAALCSLKGMSNKIARQEEAIKKIRADQQLEQD